MILGLVSNCWRQQLVEGAALEDLVSRAVQKGYGAIELRQTCLGRFEEQESFAPRLDALAYLTRAFPKLEFNLALAYPFLDPVGHSPSDSSFELGVAAAQTVCGPFPPHLRLVDTETSDQQLSSIPEQDLAARLAGLARSLIQVGGMLSLEHARQSWAGFKSLVLQAREILGEDRAGLKICYDPANLLSAADRPDPILVVQSLDPATISILHLKQFCGTELQPLVGPGEIDWESQISVLRSHGYSGPALFEIDTHNQIWEYLDESKVYLEGLGALFDL